VCTPWCGVSRSPRTSCPRSRLIWTTTRTLAAEMQWYTLRHSYREYTYNIYIIHKERERLRLLYYIYIHIHRVCIHILLYTHTYDIPVWHIYTFTDLYGTILCMHAYT
jgi:hypothetical protein